MLYKLLALCPKCITKAKLSSLNSFEMLTSTDIFGKVWKSLENYWKYSEVAGTFLEILVMMMKISCI